jgi:hypothetical protein
MHVGRRGAFVLLAFLVLWTATPTLACFMPAAQHGCCHGIMQHCSTTANSENACCQTHQSDPATPATVVSAVRSLDLVFDSLLFVTPATNAQANVFQRLAEAPPPFNLPGSLPILRI